MQNSNEIHVSGKYNTAICFTSEIDSKAEEQLKAVCDREEFSDCKIRIMPDVHAGMGCVIGTTMTISNKVVPGMVGVDIGCGMETIKLAEKELDFTKLNAFIQQKVPSGRGIRKKRHAFNDAIDLSELHCCNDVRIERARRSIGTLGSGNHFIEIDKADNGDLYLIIHSGSRHLGQEVATLYQDEALATLCGISRHKIADTIAALKASGHDQEIEARLKQLKSDQKKTYGDIPKDLTYVTGQLFDDYIHDMKIIQYFADLNRKAMCQTILEGMGLTEVDRFTTIHNYIDTDAMILRKGAVSAKQGERLLIPINMRDGSVICEGKGNEDWNFSAPHGAGRLMSRAKAFDTLSLDDYKVSMEGIYSTCVSRKTLDESPMAYKNIEDILSRIGPTADIVTRIRPVYNFKAG